MKIRLFSLFALVTLLSACSSVGHKDNLVATNGLVSTHNISNYESVVTVSAAEGEASAIEQGIALINDQIRQDLDGYLTQILNEKAKHQTNLEKIVRAEARSNLPILGVLGVSEVSQQVDPETGEITVRPKLNKADLLASVEASRIQADQDLLKYVHLSDKGTNLQKLLSLTASLPAVELKNQLNAYSSYLNGMNEPQELPNDRLGNLLDQEISSSFANFSLSLSASSDESEVFEKAFANQLTATGFNIGAYRANLIVNYFIETSLVEENGLSNVSLVGDSEMIDAEGKTFATVGNEYTSMHENTDEAINQGLLAFSEDIVSGISISVIEFMDKATAVFNR